MEVVEENMEYEAVEYWKQNIINLFPFSMSVWFHWPVVVDLCVSSIELYLK